MRLPAVLAVLSTAALASEPANFDAFLQSGRVVSLPGEAQALPGYASSVEPRLGVPAFFWAVPPAPGTPSPRSLGLTAEQAARRHLFTHAALYRLPVEQLAGSALVPWVLLLTSRRRRARQTPGR